MARFDNDRRFVDAKIVYYGPPLSGKTTNLRRLHQRVPIDQRSRLFSLNTREDRTLFFDMMPLQVGRILDSTLRLHLYTIPGQIHYKSTRRMILRGADAVVFVADSRREAAGANLAALEDLRDNLLATGRTLEDVPLVFQWNKRDRADVLGINQLEESVNILSAPSVGSVALEGEGVVETLKMATEAVVKELLDRFGGMTHRPESPDASDLVSSIFRKFLTRERSLVRRGVPEWVRNYPRASGGGRGSRIGEEEIQVFGDIHAPPAKGVEPPGDEEVQVLEPEQLLEKSLETQMRLAEEYGSLEKQKAALDREVAQREEEARQALDEALEAEQIHDDLLSTLGQDLEEPLGRLARQVETAAHHSDPRQAAAQLEAAREESQKLQALVREILSARRDVTGGLDARDLLDACREDCTPTLEEKGLTLETKVEEDLPTVAGEKPRLLLALRAAIENAARASDPDRAIRLRASYKEVETGKEDSEGGGPRRFVAVQVRDFSDGYPRQMWERIFRAEEDGRRSDLARAREILRRIGGVLQVKSREGKGNLVTLYLPVAEAATPSMSVDRTA